MMKLLIKCSFSGLVLIEIEDYIIINREQGILNSTFPVLYLIFNHPQILFPLLGED